MWHRIKRFFGFEKPVLSPPVLRPTEQLAKELEKLTPEQAVAKLREASQKAESSWSSLAADTTATPEQLDELLELVYFCYGKLHVLSNETLDAEYEQLLERTQQVPMRWMQDGAEALKQLDEYVQRYEESIYLTEATGEYVLARSEHGLFISFPFMSGAILKSAKRPAAEKTLAQLFHRSRALSFIELQSTVPWLPISFVDFMTLAKSRKLALVTDGVGYYAWLERV